MGGGQRGAKEIDELAASGKLWWAWPAAALVRVPSGAERRAADFWRSPVRLWRNFRDRVTRKPAAPGTVCSAKHLLKICLQLDLDGVSEGDDGSPVCVSQVLFLWRIYGGMYVGEDESDECNRWKVARKARCVVGFSEQLAVHLYP